MAVISNASDNRNLRKQNLLVVYVSQPLDVTKIAAQSINMKIKLKQSELKCYAKKILGFERFL